MKLIDNTYLSPLTLAGLEVGQLNDLRVTLSYLAKGLESARAGLYSGNPMDAVYHLAVAEVRLDQIMAVVCESYCDGVEAEDEEPEGGGS